VVHGAPPSRAANGREEPRKEEREEKKKEIIRGNERVRVGDHVARRPATIDLLPPPSAQHRKCVCSARRACRDRRAHHHREPEWFAMAGRDSSRQKPSATIGVQGRRWVRRGAAAAADPRSAARGPAPRADSRPDRDGGARADWRRKAPDVHLQIDKRQKTRIRSSGRSVEFRGRGTRMLSRNAECGNSDPMLEQHADVGGALAPSATAADRARYLAIRRILEPDESAADNKRIAGT